MIKQLDPIVASRIAAGEVVERPSSVLRELIDNSIDAKATKISVHLEQGGIKSLTVIDDGIGMSKEDLSMACKSHATSKITTLDDLFNLRTLGFRGEALSSIASCSLLTIDSNGNRIVVDNGQQSQILPGSVSKGTSVRMENLFENIPARKLFLKRPQSEGTECKKTFLEKALGFEEIEFLLFMDGELKLHLPKTTKKDRAVSVMALDKAFMPARILEMEYESDNTTLYAVASDPSCYKRDRTQIKILLNRRIIDSFALVQAVNNAYSAALPGGAFPFFYLFIEDNPALVDFNIHPTKRECKIRNQSQIYGCITAMVRNALLYGKFSNRANTDIETEQKPVKAFYTQTESQLESSPNLFSEEPKSPYKAQPAQQAKLTHAAQPAQHTEPSQPAQPTQHSQITEAKPFDPSWFENAKYIMAQSKKNAQESTASKPTEEPSYTYLGQVFNTFLLVELSDKLLFIDQHAAHERILYDEILAQKDVQRLMVPYRFEVDRSADDFLLENSIIYTDFGVELTRVEPLLWEMSTVPAVCRKNEAEIATYIQNTTGDLESARKGLFAIIACHAAIKAGDALDAITAKALVDKVFKLDAMLCPHGRSFTYELTKEELYKKVGRIV